jgi:hypothetical protein
MFDAASMNYKIVDLWTKKNIGTTKKILETVVPPKDVLMLRLVKTK